MSSKKKDIRYKTVGHRKRAQIRYDLIINRLTHTERKKNNCYKDVEFNLDKEEFIEWFMKNDFEGCSVDRIDNSKGYECDRERGREKYKRLYK